MACGGWARDFQTGSGLSYLTVAGRAGGMTVTFSTPQTPFVLRDQSANDGEGGIQ
jgi:hypothetical protein